MSDETDVIRASNCPGANAIEHSRAWQDQPKCPDMTPGGSVKTH